MKTLYESLLDDFDTISSKLDVAELRSQIFKFILDNYYAHPNWLEIIGPDENGLFYVSCKKRDVTIKIRNLNVTSLTNGIFVWDKVYGNFICYDCPNLTSLEGAPKEVGGSFNCQRCSKLTSLKGAPQLVGRFYCNQCQNLTSLEGAPKEVMTDFECNFCNKLKSLKGAPKKVGGDFYCGQKFSTNDVKKVSQVKGHIYGHGLIIH